MNSLKLLNITASKVSAFYLNSVRFAGHSKWQNIRSTKTTNDNLRAKLIGRMVVQVRRSILQNNRQTDPKLNKALQDVLSQANKMNVPKATIDRAIERAKDIKIITANIELEGPGKSSIIARCETANINETRREIKKAVRKLNGHLLPDDTVINMFKLQGIVRTACQTTDGTEIDMNLAEEAAIISNAEEVNFEDTGDTNEFSKSYTFITHPDIVNQCKGELEKQKFRVISCETELVAYNKIDFGQEVADQVDEIIRAIRDISEVTDVYTNVSRGVNLNY